jgi:serine/threonine-protein kinase
MSELMSRLATALAGRYKIERRLGEGGMATVYLAEDVKHKRSVALKVLRPELAAVLGAERFVQEITTTAGLQHPHILPLFDSGKAIVPPLHIVEGGTEREPPGGDVFLYYVMPFIDGETLREKLNRETQLGIDEAVRLTTEVADALDYAHRQGVIHRDIKPENILLHDGRPMVADFGIALAVSAAAGGRMTETGLSLGTPHYMSPEQATAEKDLTSRSDLYSLGSVLYEMLTGSPPHVGSSAQQIIMKIVTDEARPVTEVRKSVPRNVAAAVAKSLEKLPADRFATAKDFADALRDPGFGIGEQPTEAVAPRARSARLAWSVAALAGVVAVAAMLWPRPPATVAAPVLSATLELPADVSIDYPKLAFSPDGTRLFVSVRRDGVRQLFERRLDEFGGRIIPGTVGAHMHFSSRDGQWVAYRAGWAGGFYKVPVAGGPPVMIDDGASWADGDWAEDGTLYYTRNYMSGIWRVRSDGGAPESVTTPDSTTHELGHWSPRLLPGEQHVLYTAFRTPIDSARIEVFNLNTGDRSVVLRGGVFAQHVEGYLLYTRNEVLFAAPFDLDGLTVTGESRPVVDDVAMKPVEGMAAYAVSSNGDLAYISAAHFSAPSDLVWVDRSGRETLAVPQPGRYEEPALSPDGRRIAVTMTLKGEGGDVWVLDPVRGVRTRLTSGGGVDFGAVWTPDGRSVAFNSEQPVFDLFLRSADASGSARELLASGFDKYAGAFTPNGSQLVFARSREQNREIWRVDIDGSDPELVLEADADLADPTISPNGRWLAFQSDESGRREIYLVPYPNVEDRRQAVSSDGGTEPRWTRGGRELVWRNGAEVVSASVDPTSGEVGRPVVLFSGDYQSSSRQLRGWDVSADGERFLLVKRPPERSPRQVMLVTNWVERLRQTMESGGSPDSEGASR